MVDVLHCQQGTEEWHKARLGIPTASMFATVMAKGQSGADSKTRTTYLHKLAGEIITGQPMVTFTNHHMERGHEQENEARSLYAFIADSEVTEVGFLRADRCGASPDGLVGEAGLVEIKTALPHIMVDRILKDTFPAEHKAQCQGALMVSGREWIDIAVYCPGFPLFAKRATRDAEYIDRLADEIDTFNRDLDAIVDRIRSYRGAA